MIDVAIVGAGAAGLATAIFAAGRRPGREVVAFDGARRLGAKILVSGGGRCNLTNRSVTERDFEGGSPRVIRAVLSAFDARAARRFFERIGVPLHEEEGGKLFPDTNRSRTVLDALLREAAARGAQLRAGHRVLAVERGDGDFELSTTEGRVRARRVVLATGGLSLPKSGSDGAGFDIAAALGHSIVPCTPALVPLLLDGDFHARLSGVSQEVELCVRSERAGAAGGPRSQTKRYRGALLFTHFGVSGPVVLDASRGYLRARLEGRAPSAVVNLLPGHDVATAEALLLATARERPRAALSATLAGLIPASVAAATLDVLGIDGGTRLGRLSREARRLLLSRLLEWPLPVRDSRGYAFAETTAGGVPLDEVDPRTLGSRRCPGLFLAGEMLDVDGRLGGFSFQWAWSSAWVVASAV